jgi:hypothetical protein
MQVIDSLDSLQEPTVISIVAYIPSGRKAIWTPNSNRQDWQRDDRAIITYSPLWSPVIWLGPDPADFYRK